ncbi:MAG: hypothetical protein H6619_06775, partial [Deltaproteobacteria bacterium]|nr:hypothetical protein [Deltaproteobacteria bacterium]
MSVKTIANKLSKAYTKAGQHISASFYAPTRIQTQMTLLALGLVLIAAGLHMEVVAQGDVTSDLVGEYNDERISEAVNRIFG